MMKNFIAVLSFIIIINSFSQEQHNCNNSQLPSYVSRNHYGLCLRASRSIKKGTVVATADFQETNKPYIAGHPSNDYKHVALMYITKEGKPRYGKVRGKWAYCNHSCDPNCNMSNSWEIITNRDVAQGQELTTAYDAFIPNFPWPTTWSFRCQCRSPNCKKIINKYRTDILYPVHKRQE